MKPPALRPVLPVDRSQLPDVGIEEKAGDLLPGYAGIGAIPCAQHQAEPVHLIAGEALPARPGTGRTTGQPTMKSIGALPTFGIIRIDRYEHGRTHDPIALGKPETVIAAFGLDIAMKSVFDRSAIGGQRIWVDPRRDVEAIGYGPDDNDGGKELRLPDRMGEESRTRRVGRER